VAPWSGPRYQSRFSDTNLSLAFAAAIVVIYVVWEAVGTAPQGIVTLVGVAGGALFGAVSGDKKKKDADKEADTEKRVGRAEATADRAEVKADRLTDVAEAAHPEATHAAGLPAGAEHLDEGKTK
jgi:hypothetical protein